MGVQKLYKIVVVVGHPFDIYYILHRFGQGRKRAARARGGGCMYIFSRVCPPPQTSGGEGRGGGGEKRRVGEAEGGGWGEECEGGGGEEKEGQGKANQTQLEHEKHNRTQTKTIGRASQTQSAGPTKKNQDEATKHNQKMRPG